MQKLRFISGLMIFTMIFLNSCGGGSSTTDNEFMGELPSIEKNYANQLDELEKEIKECTNMDDAIKLGKEKELLKEEKVKAIEEYLAANPLNKDLPFDALPNTKYTINKVVVSNARSGFLNIKFLITINEVKNNLTVYFKALDSKGNYIPKSKSVAVNISNKLVPGTEYESKGGWSNETIQNMEDFAKIVEITKEEYEKK